MFNTIFPKIHKEGYKFLAISIITTFIVLFFSKFLGIIFIVISVWVYYFFRDPERYSINDDSFLVSPADGLITDISEKSGPEELRLENKIIKVVIIEMAKNLYPSLCIFGNIVLNIIYSLIIFS